MVGDQEIGRRGDKKNKKMRDRPATAPGYRIGGSPHLHPSRHLLPASSFGDREIIGDKEIRRR